MSIETDRRSIASALLDAETLSKSHLELISGQLELITLALKDDRTRIVKNGVALLEIYVDDMITLAEKLTTEAKEIWEVVSKSAEIPPSSN